MRFARLETSKEHGDQNFLEVGILGTSADRLEEMDECICRPQGMCVWPPQLIDQTLDQHLLLIRISLLQ